MELLIPGLILVALMAWASTKIKKRAAEAFEPESIETDTYSLTKPQGFLHVLESPDHEFEAYSKEFDDGDFRLRRSKIEMDVLSGTGLESASAAVCENATEASITERSPGSCRIDCIETDNTANENQFKVFYKLVENPRGIYRLRFAVLLRHAEDYVDKIEETLDSFRVT